MLDVVPAHGAEACFMPLTVGGGRARTIDDIQDGCCAPARGQGFNQQRRGQPARNSSREGAEKFGDQCIVGRDRRQAGQDARAGFGPAGKIFTPWAGAIPLEIGTPIE